MKKKFFAVIIAAASLCLALGLTACGGDKEENADHVHTYTVENVCAECGKKWEFTKGLAYKLNEETDTYTVTGIGDYAFRGRITVPYGYQGKAVTAVGNVAFPYCKGLTELVLPESITSVGEAAFYNSTDLRTIVFPSGVTAVSNYTFYGCTALQTVTLSARITAIGEHAFTDCRTLSAITLPSSVTKIGAYAFEGCTALTSVTMGENVAEIGAHAFQGCEKLTDAALPETVATIGDEAFAQCALLGSVRFADALTSIGEHAFQGCAALGSVTIPANVTKIGNGAFEGCGAIESVTWNATACGNSDAGTSFGPIFSSAAIQTLAFGSEVTLIPAFAFENCSGLTAVNGPQNLTKIGDNAFYGCSGLTSVTLPSATEIGSGAFYGCTGLTAISVPAGVTSVGHGAFGGCTNLATVTLPQGIVSIGADAFRDTAFFGEAENWQGNVLYLGTYLLAAKDTLGGAYTVEADTTVIADSAFERCTLLTDVVVPAGVAVIGNAAFRDCAALETVTLMGGEQIGSDVFEGCTALSSVSFGDHVATIGDAALYGCTALTSVTIGSGVTEIGSAVFEGCNALETITVDAANTAYSSVSGILYDKAQTQFICIPVSVRGAIVIPDTIAAIGASAFANRALLTAVTIGTGVTSIEGNAFDGCTALKAFTVAEENTAYSTADGIVYNKEQKQIVVVPLGIEGAIVIPDTVTTIGASAFAHRTSLTAVTIGAGVTSVAANAFDGCISLKTFAVAAENKNYSTADGVLYNADKTQITIVPLGIEGEITIPASVTAIGASYFEGRTGLTGITVEEANKDYSSEGGIVYNKAKKQIVAVPQGIAGAVVLPDTVTSIAASAFAGCENITSITIGAGVTSIANNAFADCTALTTLTVAAANENYSSDGGIVYDKNKTEIEAIPMGITGTVVIPDTVTAIGASAFANRTRLLSVTIGAGVTSIAVNAFNGCTALESFTVAEANEKYSSGNGILYNKEKTQIVRVPAAYTGELAIESKVTSIAANALNGCTAITAIRYAGTTSAWGTLSKGNDWNAGTGEYTVICSDGTVSKAGKVISTTNG